MRPIISGALSGAAAVFVTRFFDNFFNEITAAVILGALIGVGVMYVMRPRKIDGAGE